MKKTNSNNSRREVSRKRASQATVGRKNVRYATVTQSYVVRYSRAVSFLHDLEEKEIEMMVASSTKVSGYKKK